MTRTTRTPTYCTVEDVEETFGLPDPNDVHGHLQFSNISTPTYDRVEKYILAAEDEIDRLTRRSWRTNVHEYTTNISTYQWDENGWRQAYWYNGGNFVQLRKDILKWNPFPVCTYVRDEDDEITFENATTEDGQAVYVEHNDGEVIYDENEDPVLIDVKGYDSEGKELVVDGCAYYVRIKAMDGSGTGVYERAQTPVVDEVLYPGDKLEMRTRNNKWVDISASIADVNGVLDDGTCNWFDYPQGKLYIRTRLFQPKANSLRIRYRYGGDENTEVPELISNLCALTVILKILNTDMFSIKIASGTDLSGIRSQYMNEWKEASGRAYSAFQRSGSVHSYLR